MTMRRIVILVIVAYVAMVCFFSVKDRMVRRIKKGRNFAAQRVDGVVRFSVRGKQFDMDVYEYPNREGKNPRGGMTAEEAERVCVSRGKRLCTAEEWAEACHGRDYTKYSFGKKFTKERCNNLHGTQKLMASGHFADCRTPSGAYDMAGNLWEWVKRSETGAFQAKGGSYRDGELAERCDYTLRIFPTQEKAITFENFGVRCCRDVEKRQEFF